VSYAKPKPGRTPASEGVAPGGTASPNVLERMLVRAPDFGAPWRMAALALAVTAVMAVWLGVINWDAMSDSLGDTDDATRLVAVRALVGGQGWFDLHMMRFQPPVGTWMHWSRLLDGGIAALDVLFRLALSGPNAEFATRFVWPLLWIFPAALATLVLARRLGLGLLANAAVIAAALILATDTALYVQFHPGRIDHHDVQMTCDFVALAAATLRGRRVFGAVVAALATALGAAIGLEGLAFSAAVGACLALRLVFDRTSARAAVAYGLTLAGATAVLFAVQTPPWRWAVAACDALAVNLVVAMVVAGIGLAVVAWTTAARPWPLRLGALAVLGAAAGATYLGLYDHCIHGFFADVDPRIRPIWLNYVQEVRPIQAVLKHNLNDGIDHIALWALGGVSWLILGLRRTRWRDFAWWTTGLCLAMGVAAGASALRMSGYAEWFAVPLAAAAAIEVLAWTGYRNWLAILLAAAVASPLTVAGAAETGTKTLAPLFAKGPKRAPAKAVPKGKPHPALCFDTDQYDVLAAARPPGMVLSEVDLGPFILANTPDSALAGPYHRLSWGILRAHAILKAPADGEGPASSQAMARAQGVAYVLECRAHQHHGDRADMTRDTLQKRLDAGKPPAWLDPLSPKDDALQVYRLRSPAPLLPALPRTGA
jgi:hypothetical protein